MTLCVRTIEKAKTTCSSDSESDDRESSSESSDEYESEDDGDRPHQDIIRPTVLEPLFEGSSISVFDSHLLIYQFQLKHGLSSGGVEELLQLIKAHTSHTNGLPKSAYSLKRFFGELFPDLNSSVYSYCGSCHQPLESETSCIRPQCAGAVKETFISVALKVQLKRKMEGMIPVVIVS